MATIALQKPMLFALPTLPKAVSASVPRQASTPVTTIPATENATDEELLLAICGGAEWAMEQLYERYHRYAYTLAYTILHEVSAAEDIVQEAFLAIWRKAASYQRQHGSVRSWLQAIVHHRCIDKVRSAAYRDTQWAPLLAENEQEYASEESDVWEQAWRDEQSSLIRAALAQIPAEQRQVIALAYFGGLTHIEIAERCGVPLGTVKGRMRLGLQKMKLLLQEWGLENI